MGPGCQNKCKLRQCHGALDEGLRKQMFDEFYREGASEASQVRIVITYLFNVWLIDCNQIIVVHC